MIGELVPLVIGWILTFIQLLPDILARVLGGRG